MAQATDFHLILGIGENGGMRDFAARARCRRNADERHQGTRDFAVSKIVSVMAPVSQHVRNNLGEIQIAATPQANDDIRFRFRGCIECLVNDSK